MAKNNLIILLSTLDATEWRLLRRYVLTKTGQGSKSYKLFEYLRKNREYWPEKWDPKEIHIKLFPEISYKTFQNMLSPPFRTWVEDWIIIKSTLDHNLNKKMILLKEYSKRGVYSLANAVLVEIEQIMAESDSKDIEYHKYYRDLYHHIYFSDNPVKYKMGNEILKKVSRHHAVSAAEYSCLYSCELNSWERSHNLDLSYYKSLVSTGLSRDVIDEGHYLYLIHKMITSSDIKSFYLLKSWLYNHNWNIKGQTHTLITFYLISWSTKFWRKGLLDDASIIVHLYEYGLKTGVLLINNKIPEIRFHNIISTIGGLLENDWGQIFIEKWYSRVQSRDPSQNKNLAYAQLHFYNGEYSEIIPLLRSLKFESHGQQIRLMGLELIAWFEDRNESSDRFEQYVINFRKYLNRNKLNISQHYFKCHLNLINILNDLFKGKNMLIIRQTFEAFQHTIYRRYLSNKINKKGNTNP